MTQMLTPTSYMVSVQGGIAPEVEHATLQAALDEARRLTIKTRKPSRVLAVAVVLTPAMLIDYSSPAGAGVVDGCREIVLIQETP